MESNELKLLSPVGADPVVYYWPLCKTKQYNGSAEIVDTIRWVAEDYTELKLVMEKFVLNSVDINSYESMKILCEKYNKAVSTYRQLWKGATKPNSKCSEWATPPLLRHIIQQCYNRSVVDPEKLNQYEPFSPEVYGETSFDLIQRMIQSVPLSEDDVFIDLGSGVGQVVVQVAASSKCSRCIGIEKADYPSEFAVNMDKEFRKWMKWYGKSYQDFEIIKGDFFDRKFRETIMNANLIFVNNFAFGPEVDHKLKLIFAEMKDGTKIVSSKAFCPLNFRMTERRMNEIGSIMNLVELSSLPGAVSWTGKPVTYYLHTVDRRKLQEYFTSVKNGSSTSSQVSNSSTTIPSQHRDDVRRSYSKSSSQSSSRDSSSSRSRDVVHHPSSAPATGAPPSRRSTTNEDDEATDKMIYGPTTRRQWSSWVAQQEKAKRKTDKEPVSKSVVPKVAVAKSEPVPVSSPMHEDEVDENEEDDKLSPVNDRRSKSPTTISAKSPKLFSSNASTTTHSRSIRGPGRPRKSRTAIKAQEAKRKYQLHRRPPGRPPLKGIKKKPANTGAAWMDSLNILHQQTVDAYMTVVTVKDSNEIPTVEALRKSKNVAGVVSPGKTSEISLSLDILMKNMRQDFEQFLFGMQSPEFRVDLLQSIEVERQKQKQLQQRKDQLERQIQNLQEDGSNLLSSRLIDLDIQATTPAELLTKAKEIVLQHQDLQTKAALLESEVKTLEMQNQHLIALTREKDEQTLKSGVVQANIKGFDGALNAEETKKAILIEIGSLFTHRRAYLSEITRMENDIRMLETTIVNSNSADLTLKSPPSSNASLPHVPTPQNSSFAITSPPAMRTTPATTTVVVDVPPPVSTAKRPRQKGVRNTNAGGARKKQQLQLQQQQQQQQPAPQLQQNTSEIMDKGTRDNIDEQVEEMVRKIKDMNNAAAMTAEKEKKCRTTEKKQRTSNKIQRGSADGQSAASSLPTPTKSQIRREKRHEGESTTSIQNLQSSSVDSIDQTVDAVCHGGGAVAQSVMTFSSPGLVPVLPTTNDENERNRAASGSGSSSTESVPSDHEDFAASSRKPVLPIKPTAITVRPPIDDEKLDDKQLVHATLAKLNPTLFQQRSSSVPANQLHSSPFSIGALIGENLHSSSNVRTSTSTTTLTQYPRVRSACPRIEHVANLQTVQSATPTTTSGTDSGYAESISSSTSSANTSFSTPKFVDPPQHEPISMANLFKNTSNTGQPGNPHDYSNPGNPETKSYVAKQRSTATSSATLNTNPLVIDESPPDGTEPKTLIHPFRIPRRKEFEFVKNDSPDTRSPLATVSPAKKPTDGSSWMFPNDNRTAKKRKMPVDEKTSKRRVRAGGDAMNSFDQILGSMLLPPGSAKIKKQSGSFSETSSNSSRKLEISSRHAPADVQHHTLTKERLERHVAAVEGHHFAQKGLMEALLEHKMNTGRIEPHAQLAPKLNFTAFLKGPQTPPGTPPSPRAAAQNDRGGAGGRGPKTPQNTPPDSASLRSPSSASSVARSSENAVSVVGTGSLQNFEATVPSNAAPKNNSNATETTATLETVARLANIEPSQVAQCLSMDALQTLRDVDPTVLVATLSTLLGSIMRTVSAKKSAKKHSNVDDRSFQRERNEEQQVTSTCMLTEMDDSKSTNVVAAREQQVEMEIASSGSDTPRADSRHETSTTPTKSKTTLHNQDVGTPSSSYHPIQMTPSPGRHPPLPPPLAFDLSRPPPIIGLSSVHVAPQGPLTFPPPLPLHIPAPPPPAVALDFSVPPPCLVTNPLAPTSIPNDAQFDVFAAQLQAVTLAFLSQMSPESAMQLATDDSNAGVGFVSVLNTKKSTRFFKDYRHQSDPELLADPNFSIVFPPSVNQQSDPNDIPRVINYDNHSSSSTSYVEQHNFVEPRRRQTPPPPSFFDDVSRNSLPPPIETSMTIKEIQPMTEHSTTGYDRKPFNERRRGSFRGVRGGRGKGRSYR